MINAGLLFLERSHSINENIDHTNLYKLV